LRPSSRRRHRQSKPAPDIYLETRKLGVRQEHAVIETPATASALKAAGMYAIAAKPDFPLSEEVLRLTDRKIDSPDNFRATWCGSGSYGPDSRCRRL
jgi:beta-phosphoglucomutase-like phosphatase (HAD superfamily)